MSFSPCFLATLALAVLTGSASVFRDGVTVRDSGSGAIGSAAGDLDGDGDSEFVTASTSSTDPHLRIFNYNDGQWSSFEVISRSKADAKRDRFGGDITADDVDGDGDRDIITTDTTNTGSVGDLLWYENPGSLNGTWIEHVVSSWSGSGTGNLIQHAEIASDDINQDGMLDVVVRSVEYGFWVFIQRAPGDGSSWHPRKFVPAYPREGLALADLNRDGSLDVVINGVWFQTPDDPVNGTYLKHTYAAKWYPSGETSDDIRDYATQVECADFNRDGRPDIAVSNSEELNSASPEKPHGVRVFLSPVDPAGGTWTEVVLHDNHFSWHSLEIADFDRDGDFDVLSGISQVGKDTASSLIMLFHNNGIGSTFTRETVDTSAYVYNCSIGDYDRDGDVDLFAPYNWSSGPILVYENLVSSGVVTRPSAPTGLKVVLEK